MAEMAGGPQSEAQVELLLEQIGNRIRKNREAIGMTLMQMAERSGVAPSTIQKIERRQMTPSIAILLKIANGLGMPAGDLIASDSATPLDMVHQAAGSHALILTPRKARFEKLSADLAGAEIECWRIDVAANYWSELDPPQDFPEQIVFCLSGTVSFDLGGGELTLKPGDSIHCRDRELYGFGNRTDEPASYIIVGRFPHGMQNEIARREID